MKKLSITKEDNSSSFEAMLNPTELNLTHGINYTNCEKSPVGSVAKKVEFSGYAEDSLSFDLLLDGTGVVKDIGSESILERVKNTVDADGKVDTSQVTNLFVANTVTTKIEALKKVVYVYNGKEHEPNIVHVCWGALLFECRLTSMSIKHKLFSSDGSPLRSTVSLSFKGYSTTKEALLKAKKSSPDLTHIIEVKEGDTLPLLCHKIYKDDSYYLEVAKHNNLLSFRDLAPGQSLYFPPLQ